MFSLKPVKTEFFDLFEQLADRLEEAAAQLQTMLTTDANMADGAEAIKVLENKGDAIVHQVMKLLHESFITPLERGDIRRLVQGLDDILDSINATAWRLSLYKINAIKPEALPLAQNLTDATTAVGRIVRSLRRLKQREEFLRQCVEIHSVENEGDRSYRQALTALFKDGADPLEVIKWKEIYEFIEQGLDRCEDVADMAEGIMLENG